MAEGKGLKVDDSLIRLPEVYENLVAIRSRFSNDEDGIDKFIKLVPYLQYGIPYGELVTLFEEELLPRTYAEFDPVTAQLSEATQNMAFFYQFVDSPVVRENGYSMVLYGTNGSGKTMLALYMLAGFIERGCSGYYLHFKDYMRIFNDGTYAHETGTQGLLRHLYSCDLLVLDEIGKESKTSANVLGEFERLLKERSARRLPTIIITNMKFFGLGIEQAKLPDTSFRKKYGASTHNVLLHRYKFIMLSQEGNFRVKMRKEWQI